MMIGGILLNIMVKLGGHLIHHHQNNLMICKLQFRVFDVMICNYGLKHI